MRATGSILMISTILIGCSAAGRTERYFIAVEDNGQAALYRTVAKVTGGIGGQYKLSQGYVAASVADALAGVPDEVDDLYAPDSEKQLRQTAQQNIEKSRLAELERLGNYEGSIEPGYIKELVERYSALQTAASLSTDDQVSIGQLNTTDPYGYRKLVLIASNELLDLKKFETEFEAIEGSMKDLVQAVKTARQAKAAATKAKRDARWRALDSIIATAKEKDPTTWRPLDFLSAFSAARGAFMTP